MSDQSKQIAVITGDLVNSSALGSEKIERAMAALADCAEVQAEWHGESLRFTRHRGDGWQVVLARPEIGMRSALIFRAAVRATDKDADTHIGIAEGVAPLSLPADLNYATSDVFSVSGRALEIAKGQAMSFVHGNRGAFDAVAILLDAMSRNWTQAQSSAMMHALHPLNDVNYTEIADKLGKSRQAVTKALHAISCEEIRLALTIIEGDQRYH